MAKFQIKISSALEEAVRSKAKEMVASGVTENGLDAPGIGKHLIVRLGKEPKKVLHSFNFELPELEGKIVYLGTDS